MTSPDNRTLDLQQELETLPQQMAAATIMIEHLERTPTLKERLFSALRQGGKAAIEEYCPHPVLRIVLDMMEGWRNPWP